MCNYDVKLSLLQEITRHNNKILHLKRHLIHASVISKFGPKQGRGYLFYSPSTGHVVVTDNPHPLPHPQSSFGHPREIDFVRLKNK